MSAYHPSLGSLVDDDYYDGVFQAGNLYFTDNQQTMIHSNNKNSYHSYTYDDYLPATSTFPGEWKQESNSSSWISSICSLQQDDDFSLCDDHQQTLFLQAAADKDVAAKPNNKDEGDKKRRKRKNKKGVDDQADDTKKAITAGGSSKAGEGCVVYVRAKRGQATDSHSLAERVRRQLINDKMKLLQSLVPGCDKMVGKRLILDEIINYIHSLQTHVQFLKTRLALIDDPVFISLSNHALDSLTIHQQDPTYASLQCSILPSECSSLHETRYASVAPSSTALTSASLTLLQEYGHYNSMLS